MDRVARLRRLAIVVSVLVLGALAFAAVPAGSSPGPAKSDKSCPKGNLCVWTGVGYTGERVLIHRRKVSNKLYNKINDEASSAKLRKHGTAILWADVDGAGPGTCVFYGKDNDITNLADYSFDDTASSSTIPKGKILC